MHQISAFEGTVSFGIKAEVGEREYQLFGLVSRKRLRLKEVCCGADWELCMSCDGDTAENMVTHAWGGIF